MRILFAIILQLFLIPSLSFSAILDIVNNTNTDIRNILVYSEKDASSFFMRLDLPPKAQTSVDNPEYQANIRIDAGINFLVFEKIGFSNIKKIEISENPPILKIIKNNGHTTELSGSLVPILPHKGNKPVCELTAFRPKMPMNEVCGILPSETPRDDNGALLTGIGYAGLVWAGRLAPETEPKDKNNPCLEHMELERPYSITDIEHVLKFVYKQGYLPWQMEFPGAELDFADMPDKTAANRISSLNDALLHYFQNTKERNATIMLAPAASISDLANADNPEDDAQLLTLTLRPAAHKIILDIAAYEAGKP